MHAGAPYYGVAAAGESVARIKALPLCHLAEHDERVNSAYRVPITRASKAAPHLIASVWIGWLGTNRQLLTDTDPFGLNDPQPSLGRLGLEHSQRAPQQSAYAHRDRPREARLRHHGVGSRPV